MKKSFFAVMLALGFILVACDTSTPTAEVNVPNGVQDLPVADDLETSNDIGAQGAPGYNITLQIVGNPSQSLRDALQAGANRWQGVVTSDLPDVRGRIKANSCGSNPSFNGTIDDVLIFAGVANIDGSGGTLAQAGPCYIRSSSGLTTAGTLIFDTADVSQFSSQLSAIAVHEMGHIVGVGTLWDLFGVLSGGGGSNPTYTGAEAIREYRSLGGSGNVPVENTGGEGTRDAHWRETTFNNELMTGYLNDGSNPLSRVTIASLADLGYSVNLNAADTYALPGNNLRAAGVEMKLEFSSQLLRPVARVN
ncbi:MAG: leishmanolysin-related zinc metalloendopeptidase [Trueperaceae bacterium]